MKVQYGGHLAIVSRINPKI